MTMSKWRELIDALSRDIEVNGTTGMAVRLAHLAAEVERIEASANEFSASMDKAIERAESAEAALADAHAYGCSCCGQFLTGKLDHDVLDSRCAALRSLGAPMTRLFCWLLHRRYREPLDIWHDYLTPWWCHKCGVHR